MLYKRFEMAKFLFVVCLFAIFGSSTTESKSIEDWGLLNQGWGWFNWYYYWYWQHGILGKISDRDTICQRLWGVDYNRLIQRVDYDISLQTKILKNSSVDKSYRRLFRYVNVSKVRSKPTYDTFIDLLNNFHPSSRNSPETNLTAIKENIEIFLSSLMKTRVFQELYWYLVRNSLVVPDRVLFKETLLDLWFNKGNLTAGEPTAFQKIFVGETVNNPSKLSVRNWIQFYLQELQRINYYGFVHYYPLPPKVVSLMFSWNRGAAVTDNMLIGTSPEFEMALYTLCFFTSPHLDCECKVNVKKILVKIVTSDGGAKLVNAHFEL